MEVYYEGLKFTYQRQSWWNRKFVQRDIYKVPDTGNFSQSEDFAFESAPVTIGNRCWISSNTIILPGVTIDNGCVIACGAVVTKDCDEYGVYAGIPAKKIGSRNKDLAYTFDGGHDWIL